MPAGIVTVMLSEPVPGVSDFEFDATVVFPEPSMDAWPVVLPALVL